MVEIQSIKSGSGCCTRQLPPWPFTSLYSIAGVLCSTIIRIDLLLCSLVINSYYIPDRWNPWYSETTSQLQCGIGWTNHISLRDSALKSCSSAVSKIWRRTCHRSFIQPLFLLENSTHNGQSINGKSWEIHQISSNHPFLDGTSQTNHQP